MCQTRSPCRLVEGVGALLLPEGLLGRPAGRTRREDGGEGEVGVDGAEDGGVDVNDPANQHARC